MILCAYTSDYCKHTDEKFYKASALIYLFMSI